MYFPYLYGRQAELRALVAHAALLGSPQRIWPLVEPVDLPSRLAAAFRQLKAHGAGLYVVTNPHQGALQSPSAVAQWSTVLAGDLADPQLVRPVLQELPSTTVPDIAAFATAHAGRDVGLVLRSTRLPYSAIASALDLARTIIFLAPGASGPAAIGAFGAGRTVNIGDNFQAQERNADYSGTEWLSNSHQTFGATGQPGFSDFTVLPSKLVAGGGPVGAAAIHLTYLNSSDRSLWVQHFISDETDRNIGNSSSKLLEAIAHLEAQMIATPRRFLPSPAIAAYREQRRNGRATSLSGNKSLQIRHHLFTVGRALGI